MTHDFITQAPRDPFLATLVDTYFFIDIPADSLLLQEEYIIPFPRITFGYFFDHPFSVTNHDLGQTVSVDMAISRISPHKISVQPQSDRIRIIGAHVRPYTLAYLTEQPIGALPWLIHTEDLFGEKARMFRQTIRQCRRPEDMFAAVEKIFLDTLLPRDLSLITRTVERMEAQRGDGTLLDIARQAGVTERTLRNHFHRHIGCTPKAYMSLVKLRNAAYHLSLSNHSMTEISYESEYFDQAHFIHAVKRLTGRTPKALRKEMPAFRFLQF